MSWFRRLFFCWPHRCGGTIQPDWFHDSGVIWVCNTCGRITR